MCVPQCCLNIPECDEEANACKSFKAEIYMEGKTGGIFLDSYSIAADKQKLRAG